MDLTSWISQRVLGLQGSGPLKLHALWQYQNYGCTVQYWNQEEGRVWSCNEGTLNNAHQTMISILARQKGSPHVAMAQIFRGSLSTRRMSSNASYMIQKPFNRLRSQGISLTVSGVCGGLYDVIVRHQLISEVGGGRGCRLAEIVQPRSQAFPPVCDRLQY